MILRAGHSFVRKRRHALGDKTSVSQAATVRVHTKKYLCADKCGGKSRDGGSAGVVELSAIAGPVAVTGRWSSGVKDEGKMRGPTRRL